MLACVRRQDVNYYQELMGALRGAIEAGTLAEYTAAFEAEQAAGDLEPI
jgi:queuine tRNA-ribosyltransferase